MVADTVSDKEFIELFEEFGATETSRKLNMQVRSVFARRSRIEQKLGQKIANPKENMARPDPAYIGRQELVIGNGVILVGSDCHYYPNVVTPAHRAFIKFCKELKPSIVIMNGDVLDGTSISRHPPQSWESYRPTLIEEIENCQERLSEIEASTPNAKHIWTIGNHDSRFESRLARMAPEYASVYGMQLSDHFPNWTHCMSVWVNNKIVIKHRYKGSIHATHQNAVNSGKTMVTGHLHSLKVTPFTDYNETRYGVDTGTMADINSPTFNYTEDNPKNWRQGFVVLTIKNKHLVYPEVVHVLDEKRVEFRGDILEV